MISATQQVEERISVTQISAAPVACIQDSSKACSSRWGPPKANSELQQIRLDGIPKCTQKMTDWSLSVWHQWASCRRDNLIEESESRHALLTKFTDMTEESMKICLEKFVVEVRRGDGNSQAEPKLKICYGRKDY